MMHLLLNRFAPIGLCLGVLASAASADSFLIVPGRSIGQTSLGPNGAAELKRLPKPEATEGGMNQLYLVWAARTPNADTLFIHGVWNAVFDGVKPADGITIDQIRVTSHRFHTREGISTTSTLAQIRRRFPYVRPGIGARNIYDDTRRGIAFEFSQPVLPSSRCIGISILEPLPEPVDSVTSQGAVDDLLKTRGRSDDKSSAQQQTRH